MCGNSAREKVGIGSSERNGNRSSRAQLLRGKDFLNVGGPSIRNIVKAIENVINTTHKYVCGALSPVVGTRKKSVDHLQVSGLRCQRLVRNHSRKGDSETLGNFGSRA